MVGWNACHQKPRHNQEVVEAVRERLDGCRLDNIEIYIGVDKIRLGFVKDHSEAGKVFQLNTLENH